LDFAETVEILQRVSLDQYQIRAFAKVAARRVSAMGRPVRSFALMGQ
jgi:hypothetical protein